MESVLDLRLLLTTNPGDGPLVINCVSRDHADEQASMGVYPDHAWCFGCQTYMGPKTFAALVPTNYDFRRTGTRKEKAVSYLPLSLADTYETWLFETGRFRDRLEWLHARGLRDDTLRANHIGHSGEAFTIPVIQNLGSEDELLLTVRYRRDDGMVQSTDRPKYWGTAGRNAPMLYTPHPPIQTTRPVMTALCEGELDALRLAQEGWRAVSMTNGAGAFKQEHVDLLPDGPIAVFYDQDQPGTEAAYRIANLLPGRAVVVRWPQALGKDVTEFLQRWPLQALERKVTDAL